MNKYEDYKKALQVIVNSDGRGLAINELEDFDKINQLVEKEKPKKPKPTQFDCFFKCPLCSFDDIYNDNDDMKDNYCANCGQRLDWN